MRAKRDKAFPLMDASSAVLPTVRELGATLFLAYYLPRCEASAVVSFSEVIEWNYGYPNDEGLQEHSLYGKGLRHYQFHRVVHPGPSAEPVRPYHWIATFHDGTFEIKAESWRTEAVEIAELAPWKALDSLLSAGENNVLDEQA